MMATPSTVVIGTREASEGPIVISLDHRAAMSEHPDLRLLWEGKLPVTSGSLSLVNVYWEVLVAVATEAKALDVCIWGNDEFEPDRLVIEVVDENGR